MTTIETNGRQIVAVEVPAHAKDFYISPKLGLLKYDKDNGFIIYNNRNPIVFGSPDNCKIIGLLSELTAEQCEPYINYSEMNPDIIDYEEDLLGYILRSNNIDTTKPLLIIEKLNP